MFLIENGKSNNTAIIDNEGNYLSYKNINQ